jgi:uncharacterized membrane protein YidH (DUF202 family)
MTVPTGQGPTGHGPTGQEDTGQEDTGHGPAGQGRPGQQQPQPGDDPEERDPGLAHERTSLSWTRTAISFAALGGTVLKANVITGLIILAIAPVIWQLGRVSRGNGGWTDLPAVSATRLFIITVSIVAVSLLCLVVAIFGNAVPGALR